jgi:hypothetical protein
MYIVYKIKGMEEKWKKVNGFDAYEISNFGNIRSYQNNRHGIKSTYILLKPTYTKLGYGYVQLQTKPRIRKYVHRLVATHFLENPNNYIEVDHIDRNPRNCHYTNLRWCSRSMNMRNTKIPTTNTSGERNIMWDKSKNKWMVQITINKVCYRKRFTNMKDAKIYRDTINENM